jgi:hypothetical protein
MIRWGISNEGIALTPRQWKAPLVQFVLKAASI